MPTAKAAKPAVRELQHNRKRLVVFCDGTWNDLRMPSLTNVARLAKCVSRRGWDGRLQIVFYDAGVGVATGVSPLVDRLVAVVGGALGGGLDDKIETAYRFLVLNYEPGDEIFVFGFSRGAYTARSLIGMIRKCGIVRLDCFEQIPNAMRIYRDPKIHPADIVSFRAAHGHRIPGTKQPIATGVEDLPDALAGSWFSRTKHLSAERAGMDEDRATGVHPPTPPPMEIYRVMYLGLWDTVGSLGVPSTIPLFSKLMNRKYDFHDLRVSSLIYSLRHAVALDEDRKSFDVSSIGNIHELNEAWASLHNLQLDHEDRPGYVPYHERPFQQMWFPGSHGAVGGGNAESGLSSATLIWVAVGAMLAGLKFEWTRGSELARAKELRAPFADWRIRRDGRRQSAWEFDGLGFLTGYRDRKGPLTRNELSLPAIRRMEHPAGSYRPATLKRFTNEAQPTPPHRIMARILGLLAWIAILGLAAYLSRGWLAGFTHGFL